MTFNVVKDWNHGTCTSAMWAIRSVRLYIFFFQIWQCGGTVKWVPCSRVGHIYRNHMPYSLGKDNDPYMSPIHVVSAL